MEIIEADFADEVIEKLIELSKKWEEEESCYGYYANERENIEGNRIFLAKEGEDTIGYLFGHNEIHKCKNDKFAAMKCGTEFFEVEEIYVLPEFRSKGVGKALFDFAEKKVKAEYFVLSTATKDYKRILHFYIDEIGMDFWSARLFKKIR